jgi:hypothetical protein
MSLILILQLVASNYPMTIQADPRCTASPNVVYTVGELVCVPSGILFKSGFEL